MMATTDTLDNATRTAIAGKLASFVAKSATLPAAPAAAAAPAASSLGESLNICTLTVEQVLHPPADLAAIAKPSGMWHHQVHTGGVATHTARTHVSGLGGGGHEVTQVFETPIARKIDDAIAWLDTQLGDTPATVRLLIAPAYYLHALLVIRGNDYSAVVADQPATYTQLKIKTLYPLKDFVAKLALENPSGNLTGVPLAP
jgi:hypothetical protein